MTTTILTLVPADGSTTYSARGQVAVVLTSDDPVSPLQLSQITIMVSGAAAVIYGQPQPGFAVGVTERPEILGFEFSILVRKPLAEDRWHDAVVLVDGQEIGRSTWRVPMLAGPRVVALTPTLGADGASTTPTVTIDLASDDPTATVVLRTLATEANDGVVVASQLTSEATDFRDTEGRCVEVAGTPFFIVSVIGPHIVALDAAPGAGTGLNVRLFRPDGLDVAITEGVQPVTAGVARTGTGWSAVLSVPHTGWRRVVLTRTGAPFAAGQRVDIGVQCADDVGRRSKVNAHFNVGQTRPAVLGALAPRAGTTGTPVAVSPTFDVVDVASDITLASLQVHVDGVAAIVNGVPAGIYSTSTVTPIANGQRVVLTRTGNWIDGRVVPVTVNATDVDGNAMAPTSWLWHFGAVVDDDAVDVAGGQLVADDVLRVLPFDFTGTPFADPGLRQYTGFARDGWWYDHGTRDPALRASWAMEAASANRSAVAEMPLSGFVVVGEGSWSIVDTKGALWMRATALPTGPATTWSMAGVVAGQGISDAAMPADDPSLFLATGKNITHVSFADDRAYRITDLGRQESMGGISARASNQDGNTHDDRWALSASAAHFDAVAAWAAGPWAWMVTGVRNGDAEMSWDIVDDAQQQRLTAAAGLDLNFSRKSALLDMGQAAPWSRAHTPAGPTAPTTLVAAAGISVVVLDWAATLGALAGVLATITSPDMAASPVNDLDLRYTDIDGQLLLLVAQDVGVALFDLSSLSSPVAVDDWTLTDLGVATMDQALAVAMDPACERDSGFFIVAASAVGDGRVIRFRHQWPTATPTGCTTVLSTGIEGVASVAALSRMPHAGSRFVGLDMVVLADAWSFVGLSFVLE